MTQLEHGRESFDRRAWGEAYAALTRADCAAPLDTADLDRLATAAYLTGREPEFQQILERCYRIHLESGDRACAARRAFWLSVTFMLQGDRGHASAWTARGLRLVDDRDCVERGYLDVAVAEQQLLDGQLEAAYTAASDALARGERCGDAELIAMARHAQGRTLIQQHQVRAGLQCLDDTMLAAVAGELGPILTGLMYCSVIDACRQVYALDRAREWTAAFSSVCEQQPDMVAFTGTCLVHRAEILQLQGAWPQALTEAGRACAPVEGGLRKPPGAGLYRQAEIHRLCGEFARAEEAYRAASERGFEPQPGLALLRLAQGQTGAACAAARRLAGATRDRVRRAAFLPAHVEIMLACGDLAEARRAGDELCELADALESDALRAVAAQADGAIAIAKGDAHAAIEPLRCALQFWTRFNAPYEAACVRVLLGQACRTLGDDDAAELETQAARRTFEQLGARPDLARADVPRQSSAPKPLLTARELHVLRLVATGSTNREIARELSLSERTIDRHVTNILTKLDVRSRTAATSYAFDHKLF